MATTSVGYAGMACDLIDRFDRPSTAEKPRPAHNMSDPRWASVGAMPVAHRTRGLSSAFYHFDAGALVRRGPQLPVTMEVLP